MKIIKTVLDTSHHVLYTCRKAFSKKIKKIIPLYKYTSIKKIWGVTPWEIISTPRGLRFFSGGKKKN